VTTPALAEAAPARAWDEVLADAVRALTEAARLNGAGDWAEFVTQALAGAAANIGSTEGALAGRPGSWEADGVRSLLASTVGWNDEWLLEHRTEPVRVTLFIDEILVANEAAYRPYDDAQQQLAARPAADEEALDAIADLEERLERQRLRDWQEYGDSLKTAVEAAASQLPLRVPVVVTVDIETFRPYDDRSQPGAVEEQLLTEALGATPLPASWARPPLERLEATS
jgi:hypothetical protein